MKTESFVVIFFIAMLSGMVLLHYKIQSLQVMDTKTEEYNRNIDQATDDAMQDMVKLSDSFSKTINLEECRDGFFNSLYTSFGIADSATGQNELSLYIPLLLVTDTDGFYICHHCMNEVDSVGQMQWTEKLPYYYSGSISNPDAPSASYRYVINYKMTDEISLALTYDGNTTFYEGKYKYLTQLYSDDHTLRKFIEAASQSGRILNEEKFDEIRISAMTYQITKKMNYYVNEHNKIASNYGISYSFRLPESSMDTFARAIDSISLLAIFQGYPYGVGTEDVYSRFSLSGSRLFKTDRYVVERGTDGILYYHRQGCKEIVNGNKTYSTKKKCAEHGAYPCGVCNP